MKKIVILCGCIAVVLLLGFADGVMQKKRNDGGNHADEA